jgi:hypothetical protein
LKVARQLGYKNLKYLSSHRHRQGHW